MQEIITKEKLLKIKKIILSLDYIKELTKEDQKDYISDIERAFRVINRRHENKDTGLNLDLKSYTNLFKERLFLMLILNLYN